MIRKYIFIKHKATYLHTASAVNFLTKLHEKEYMKVTIQELKSLIAEAIKECGDMWMEPEAPMDREISDLPMMKKSLSDPYSISSPLADKAALMPNTDVENPNLMGDENPSKKVTLVLPLQEKKRKKKWMQAAVKKPGALSKELGVPEEENIPMDLLQKKKAALSKKAEGDKKLSAHERKLLQRINFAITAKKQAAKKKKKPAKKVDESFIRNEIAKIIKEELGK